MKSYKIIGEILSPVHIGTGEELEPFDYVIKDGKLIRFDLIRVLDHLSEEERDSFNRLNDRGSLVELRKFIAEVVDPQTDALYTCDVTRQIEDFYQKKLHDKNNQMFIKPFIRTGGVPYIPGSSLKGAIRTAVISLEAEKDERSFQALHSRVERDKNKYEEEYKQRRHRARKPNFRYVETTVLGHKDAKQDPFRALKFSDIRLKMDDILVSQVDNIGTTDRDQSKPPRGVSLQVEHTYGTLLGKPVTFEGECRVDDDLMRYKGNGISRSLDMAEIIKSCYKFYCRRFDSEEKKYFMHTNDELKEKMNNLLSNYYNDECIVRLGRFSAAPSMTLDGLRWIPPRDLKGVTYHWKEPGKTRFYKDGKYPFGWVKLRFKEV